MATRKKPQRLQHLYITEWMEHLKLSDIEIAKLVGIERESVWRWRTKQHMLNPMKLQQLADAMGIHPSNFWHPPSRPSLDALVHGAPDEVHRLAHDLVRTTVRRPS